MNRIKKALSIFVLSLLPSFLCCASKELDEEYSHNYDDITVVPTLKALSVEGDKSIYDLVITNDGNGYINKDRPLIYKIDSSNLHTFYFPRDNEIFRCDELIKPGDTYTLEVEINTDINFFNSGYFYACAYIEPQSNLLSDYPKTVVKCKEFYEIDEEIVGRQSTFVYQYAVTLDYLGTEYCIKCNDDSNNKVFFYTSTDIDESQVNIKKIDAFCYRPPEKDNFMHNIINGVFLTIIVVPALILFAVTLICVLVIICVKIYRKKKRLGGNTRQ